MSTKRFLGYDTDENGKLIINRRQEPIVVRLFHEFLDGKTTEYIKRIFEKEGSKEVVCKRGVQAMRLDPTVGSCIGRATSS